MTTQKQAIALAIAVFAAGTGAVSVHAQSQRRPATSAVTATTCLEKLASGASKSRCEDVATKTKTKERSSIAGTNRSSFINPRAPGTGVVTVVGSDARK
jgi:hypothetical protein